MPALFQEIVDELSWFIGREANYTTILSHDNDYEYYYEGRVQIDYRKIKQMGEVIDILLVKGDYGKGSNLEIKQLKAYTVDKKEIYGYLIHKTLTIYLRDGSLVILAAENVEPDPQETDIELSESHVRYLFQLPSKFNEDQ